MAEVTRTRWVYGLLSAMLAFGAARPQSASADDAKPYWRLDVGRMMVVSNSSAQRCKRLAASLVRFEQMLFAFTGWEPGASLPPLQFFSLERADAARVMLSEAERERQKKERIVIYSKYLPDAASDVAVIADVGGDEPLQSVLFLYAQGLLSHGPTRSHPAWFQLGIASLMNGVLIKPDGTALLNRDLRFQAVAPGAKRPREEFDLPRLLATDIDDLTPDDFNAFALQAREWAVFGLLTSREREAQWRELALLMRQGAPADEAVLEAFDQPLTEVAAEFDSGRWRKDARFRLPASDAVELPDATPVEPEQIESLLQLIAERAKEEDS